MIFTLAMLAESSAAQPLSSESEVLVCPLMHAKVMPDGFPVKAMTFTGPSGEGRRGSAGFVVQTEDLVNSGRTRWKFTFQRDASGFGFQVIHPLKKGHVVVSVVSGVTIHRGGDWGDIGWGNPSTSDKIVLTADAEEVLPLKTNIPLSVVSQLSRLGEYELWIDDVLVCRHMTDVATPLISKVPSEDRFWGGSSWDRTAFAGDDFSPRLKTGHAGVILGPMDGSGPRHFVEQVTLTALPDIPTGEVNQHFEPLFAKIDDAREFSRLNRSRSVGGNRGGPFESIPDQPSLLVGFDYTTSTLYGGHLTVKSVRPIFLSRDGEFNDRWHGVPHGKVYRVHAKDGYVVAGIIAKGGYRVDGIRLIYMRVKNGRLNPDDTYRSSWIGGQGGGAETQCAANGEPVIGIYGQRGHDLDAIGFVQITPPGSAANVPDPEQRRQ
ncbi:MAG: hypothetical protein O3B13_15600 [Planctomycetota bacterium]|nr:hypothetical protein [Planctomycetota bacterium]